MKDKILVSLGYRKVKTDKNTAWMKTIGYSLFIIKEDNRLYQYFIGKDKKIHCMESWDLIFIDGTDKDILIKIKDAENYHHQIHTAAGSSFEFLTLEEQLIYGNLE